MWRILSRKSGTHAAYLVVHFVRWLGTGTGFL